jgi:hypothetical protein
MLTLDELEREKYEARLKYQRDEAARLLYATKMGEKRGALIGRIQLAERVLKHEQTSEEVLRAMTLEQLRQLADKLEVRLGEIA